MQAYNRLSLSWRKAPAERLFIQLHARSLDTVRKFPRVGTLLFVFSLPWPSLQKHFAWRTDFTPWPLPEFPQGERAEDTISRQNQKFSFENYASHSTLTEVPSRGQPCCDKPFSKEGVKAAVLGTWSAALYS
jgi:hypothetical protein